MHAMKTQGTLLMHFARQGKARTGAVAAGARRRPRRSQQEREDGGGDRTHARGDRAIAYEVMRGNRTASDRELKPSSSVPFYHQTFHR